MTPPERLTSAPVTVNPPCSPCTRRWPLLCALLLTAPPALANDAGLDLFELPLRNLLQMEISSASGFTESNQSAAASVTRIERAHWERWGARKNLDALDGEAGIIASPTIGSGIALSIRGYTQLLSVRGVLTLIDGVAVNDMGFGSAQYENEHITPGVLDSIELIRGPSSTLYGTDAFHGVLSLNTFSSTGDSVEAALRLGSEQYSEGQLRASGGHNGHYLNLALDGRHQNEWGQTYCDLNTGLLDERAQEHRAGSAVVKLHNGTDETVRYQLSAYYNDNSTYEGLGGGAGLGSLYRDTSYANSEFHMLRGSLSRQWSEQAEVGFTTSFWHLDRASHQSLRTGISGLTQRIDRNQQQAFVRWQNARGDRVFTALEYSDEHIGKATTDIYNLALEQVSSTSNPIDGTGRQIASLVTQGRWQTPWQVLAIEAGLRLDDYSDAGFQPTPRLGLIYELHPQHTLKLLYGEAFRAGVGQELAGSLSFRGVPDLEPEELASTELVYLFSTPQSALQLTAFQSQWDNAVINIPLLNDPDGYNATYANAASNNSHGLELSFRHQRGPWTLQLGSSWVQSESEYTGQAYAAFPEWMVKGELGYQLNSRTLLALRTDIRTEQAEGPYSTTFTDPAELPGYVRWDMVWQQHLSPDLQLTTTLRNLFDHDNRLPSLVNNPGGDPDFPRLLEVGIRASW